MMNLKKVTSNIVWLFSDLVIKILMSLVVGIIIARYLGPEQFGKFCFVFYSGFAFLFIITWYNSLFSS